MSKKQISKRKGIAILIFGVLILINSYMPFLNWGAFIGIALILAGFFKFIMPNNSEK
jgi:uncharacterized membrane protein HdeD (DUF308 family)